MAISCIVCKIDILLKNCEIFIPHLYLAPSKGVTPLEFAKLSDIHKTKKVTVW